MDVKSPRPEETEDSARLKRLSRRGVLKAGALGLASASTLGVLASSAKTPNRVAHAAPSTLPDIQFDLGNFIAPVQTINDVLVQFGPVYTGFITVALTRTPTKTDQTTLANALNTIEANYAFSSSGLFTMVSYGIPYFNRLPGGMTGSLVSSHMPRLSSNTSRYVLEEAVPSPTDVCSANPSITKLTYNVPVKIETNDMLFTIRSDSLTNIVEAATWFGGSNILNNKFVPSPNFSGLLAITSIRLEFAQIGLTRQVANSANLPYATRINPQSPMWMGFTDQQVKGSGPAAICTFLGNSSAKITNATSADYFANGSIQHLSHNIQDLAQFYADVETYQERVQYMFRSNPIPSLGNTDQFTDGGGPATLENVFQGTGDALANALAQNTFQNAPRMGHESALQRSSRAADGTPMHIRMDGPGFDNMDVPDGSYQPKLQFTVMVPTADFFTTMRRNAAALDLLDANPSNPVADEDNGLERFITATRRQNFLMPSRTHRAFPLIELT